MACYLQEVKLYQLQCIYMINEDSEICIYTVYSAQNFTVTYSVDAKFIRQALYIIRFTNQPLKIGSH